MVADIDAMMVTVELSRRQVMFDHCVWHMIGPWGGRGGKVVFDHCVAHDWPMGWGWGGKVMFDRCRHMIGQCLGGVGCGVKNVIVQPHRTDGTLARDGQRIGNKASDYTKLIGCVRAGIV